MYGLEVTKKEESRKIEPGTLTFAGFQHMLLERNKQQFASTVNWNIADWLNAIAGEVGELCNLTKKVRRGDFKTNEEMHDIANKMAKECADIMAYTFCFLSYIGRDAEIETINKFEEVNKRKVG